MVTPGPIGRGRDGQARALRLAYRERAGCCALAHSTPSQGRGIPRLETTGLNNAVGWSPSAWSHLHGLLHGGMHQARILKALLKPVLIVDCTAMCSSPSASS